MAKTIPAGLRYLQIFSCHGCQSCYEVSPDGESMEQFDHILSQTDITDELTGDDPEWIKKLRVELMMSKNTHNFDFSRDEVMELMRLNMKDAAHSYNQKQEIENLRALVDRQANQIANLSPDAERWQKFRARDEYNTLEANDFLDLFGTDADELIDSVAKPNAKEFG